MRDNLIHLEKHSKSFVFVLFVYFVDQYFGVRVKRTPEFEVSLTGCSGFQ